MSNRRTTAGATNRRRKSSSDPPRAAAEPKPKPNPKLEPKAGTESTRPASWPAAQGPVDPLLAGVIVGLVAFGVVMVYSASAVFAYDRHGDGQYFLVRQGIYAAMALTGMVVAARIDYHRLRVLTYPLLIAATSLLAATSFGLGRRAGGASRWIQLGPINVQPAEVVKLALICWLAYSLSKKAASIRTFSIGFLPHVVMAGVLMLLCLKQPDFGSAVMIGLLTFVMLFTAGARLGYMLGAGVLAAPIVYHLVAGNPYRMRRITAFLEPFEHRRTAGYQVAESLLSLGSGGVTGVGMGDSRQKLLFLPEAHTDFIGAIVGEELGFLGIAALIGVFLVVVWRGMRTAYDAHDDYGTYLAAGITLFIGLQAFTNLGVVVGMLPTKGLVLPFVSYGGSALMVNCAAAGVLLNVSRRRGPEERKSPVPAARAAPVLAGGAS